MSLFVVLAVALAAPVAESSAAQDEPVVSSEGRISRGALPPDTRRNVRESAHVLSHGELLLGTDGVAVGVLPAVQVSTQALLDAAPSLKRRKSSGTGHRQQLKGDPPSPINPPPGCAFAERCPRAQAICREEMPDLEPTGGTMAACRFPGPAG